MTNFISISKVFDASVEEVWEMWTDSELVKQWWGPDKFICDIAEINFREGGTSLVNMKAPNELGGAVHFSIWTYTKIVFNQSIEYIHNLADKNGVKQKPVAVGMPLDFPEDIRTVVTFKTISKNKTEVTVNEYADFGQTTHFAKIGLVQSLDKMSNIFINRNN